MRSTRQIACGRSNYSTLTLSCNMRCVIASVYFRFRLWPIDYNLSMGYRVQFRSYPLTYWPYRLYDIKIPFSSSSNTAFGKIPKTFVKGCTKLVMCDLWWPRLTFRALVTSAWPHESSYLLSVASILRFVIQVKKF